MIIVSSRVNGRTCNGLQGKHLAVHTAPDGRSGLRLGGHEPARSRHRDQGHQKQEAEKEEEGAQAPSRGTEKESAFVEHHEGTPLLLSVFLCFLTT